MPRSILRRRPQPEPIEYNGAMSLDLARIQALCFDVDGTLSDSDDYYVGRIAARLKQIPFMADPVRSARRLVMWIESPANAVLGLADTLGLDDEIISVIDWMYRHRKPPSRDLPVIAGVPDLLPHLHRRYPLAVVSARDQESTMSFLEHAGLVHHFDAIITALSAKHTKPYPDPIRLAAQKMGVAPEACLMIGDTTVDIRAGTAAGSQTAGVLCGYGEEAELRQQGADIVLATTSDLGAVLDGAVA